MSLELEDIEDIKEERTFDRELQRRHHKELLQSLNSIVSTLNQNHDKSGIGEKQLRAIEELKATIRSLPAPDVSVNLEQEKVLAGLRKMEEGIVKELKEKNKKDASMQEWEVEIKRNNLGVMNFATFKQIK